MASKGQAPDPPEVSLGELRAKKDALEKRLEDGFIRIGIAEEDGTAPTSVEAWTDFWQTLLKEYEDVCNHINGVRR